jgi:hypothetical protein
VFEVGPAPDQAIAPRWFDPFGHDVCMNAMHGGACHRGLWLSTVGLHTIRPWLFALPAAVRAGKYDAHLSLSTYMSASGNVRHGFGRLCVACRNTGRCS